MKFFKLLMPLFISLTASLYADLPHIVSKHPLQCDWQKIDVYDVAFPKGFGWGAATSAFQVEGTVSAHGKHIENTWTRAMQQGKANSIGVACDHWKRSRQDVKLIKKAGLNEYRFSIKWSAVMPKQNSFDKYAMAHYVDLVRELVKKDITPYVMLFHHAWPLWFDAKLGFEKKQNINDFVRFSKYVFTSMRTSLKPSEFKRIKWMTLNEPVGYCLEGYFRGKYPPYKKDLKLTGTVIKNMLDAHAMIYHAFKKIDVDAQIGFAKVIVPIDPYRAYHPIDAMISSMFDHLSNYSILSYFRTGEFTWGFPGYGRVKAKNKKAKGTLDFIAVNYYFNVMLNFQMLSPKVLVETIPDRPVWGKHKSIYPEGMYRAVANVAKHLPGVPLMIGENGIATDNAEWREQYIKTHLYVVNQLIKDGYDIRAYHWWALMDTYSWGKGEFSPYGFYAVDPVTHKRTLRKDEGFKDFLKLIKTGSYA